MDESPTIGQTKRLLEWWCCSERFRRLVAADPERARREYRLGIDPDLVRPLWDPSRQPFAHHVIKAYEAFLESRTDRRARIRSECSPDEPRFRKWRARQIERNALEGWTGDIIHAPFAIELADGCSVGCWFCGVGAGKLVDVWRYTSEHVAEWRDVLSVLRRKIGPAAQWGFCYWATDPLDNPDYERFALDFHDVVGMFPQTTTAQALSDPARTRRLLELAAERGCRQNRFSVLTEAMLRGIYDEYSADELTDVEIVPLMREALIPKADSGAFRVLARNRRNVLELEQRKAGATAALPGTIACVSGFLLNMVKHRVKLISPCRASDDWPLGYIVFDERIFTDAADLDRQVEELIESCMLLAIKSSERVRLNPAFSYEPATAGFSVMTPTTTLTVRQPDMPDYIRSLGDQLCAGRKTPSEIAFSAFYEYGVPEPSTLGTLDLLFERGVLVEARGRA